MQAAEDKMSAVYYPDRQTLLDYLHGKETQLPKNIDKTLQKIMVDPLSLLRQFTIDEKNIEERDDQIIFNEFSWNKDSLTNFIISSSKSG